MLGHRADTALRSLRTFRAALAVDAISTIAAAVSLRSLLAFWPSVADRTLRPDIAMRTSDNAVEPFVSDLTLEPSRPALAITPVASVTQSPLPSS
jgi:hypothetical protein